MQFFVALWTIVFVFLWLWCPAIKAIAVNANELPVMGQLRRFPDFNVGATAFAAHHGSMVLIHAPVGVWPAYRRLTVYHCQAMPLARPIPLRLSPNQLQWLDSWRGDTISRSAAIRLLLDQSIRFHRDGILPASRP